MVTKRGNNFYGDKRKYKDYDSYDGEYHKGKHRRESTGFGSHSNMHYRNGWNPLEGAENFSTQTGGHRTPAQHPSSLPVTGVPEGVPRAVPRSAALRLRTSAP